MFLRPGIFVLVAVAACLCATESDAQILPRGRQTAVSAARFFAVRNSPALRVGRVVQSGSRVFGGRQGVFTGNQRAGAVFGNGNGLPARRLIQAARIISRF